MKFWFLTLALLLSLNSFASAKNYANEDIRNYVPENMKGLDEDLFKYFMGDKRSRDIGFNLLFERRAFKYAPADLYYQTKLSSAINRMVKILDVDLILFDTDPGKTWTPDGFVLAAFKTKLISMLKSAETNSYLKKLDKALIEALGGFIPVENPSFNLWKFSVDHFNGNKLKAVEHIAVLFQDTTFAKLHLELLEKRKIQKTMLFQESFELLADNISRMSMTLQYNTALAKKLFFPKLNVLDTLNANFYHFYVPMYLAMKLKTYKHKPYFAFTASWLLTITYEVASLTSDYQNILKDPKTLTNRWSQGDIYTGYTGALYGAGYKELVKRSFLQENAEKNFSRTMKSMFRFHVGKYGKQK